MYVYYGTSNNTIDAGAGADILQIDGAVVSPVTATLGDGQDAIRFRLSTVPIGLFGTITDFASGAGGDKLDLSAILNSLVGYDGSNPFGTGFLQLPQDGADTLLEVDQNGGGDSYTTLFRFQNTSAAGFTSENFLPTFAPAGGEVLLGGPNIDNLTAGPGNDEVYGFGDHDVLNGAAGDDNVFGGDGDDHLTGDAGADRLGRRGGHCELVGLLEREPEPVEHVLAGLREDAGERADVAHADGVGGKLQNTVIHTYPNVSQFWTYKQEEYLKLPVYDRNNPPCKFCD